MDTFGPGQSHMYDYPNNQEPTTLLVPRPRDGSHARPRPQRTRRLLPRRGSRHRRAGRPADGRRMHFRAVDRSDGREVAAVLADPGSRPADPEQPTACDDIPIMFQQVPAEMLSGQEFQPNAIAARERAGEHPVSGGVDGQRHPRAVPDGQQQAVPLPVPQRQRRGTVADLDHHRRRRSDVVLVGRLPAAGRYGRRADELGGGRRPTVADPHPTVPGQRADVVIDFSKITTKTTIYLQSNTLQAFVGGTSPSCLTGPCEFGDNVDQTPVPLVKFVVEPTNPPPHQLDPPDGVLRNTETSSPITRISTTTPDGEPVPERTLLFGFDGAIGQEPVRHHQRAVLQPPADDCPACRRHHRDLAPDQQHRRLPPGAHPRHRVPGDVAFEMPERRRTTRRTSRPIRTTRTVVHGRGSGDVDDDGHTARRLGVVPRSGTACNLAWTDVFVIPPYSQVKIIGTFTDNVGTYVFHCHNLIHEDAGMMAQFEVIADGPSPTATGTTRHTRCRACQPRHRLTDGVSKSESPRRSVLGRRVAGQPESAGGGHEEVGTIVAAGGVRRLHQLHGFAAELEHHADAVLSKLCPTGPPSIQAASRLARTEVNSPSKVLVTAAG